VVGFAEMLGEGRAGVLSEMQAGFVSNIRRAARQLVEGIESLGDLASVHAGPVVGATGAVALGPTLRGAMGLLARRAEEAGIGLSLASQTTEPVVWGDTARIRQLVYTLVAEAVHATRPGSRLRLGATAEGETVALWCVGVEAPDGGAAGPGGGSGISAEPLDDGTTRFIVRLPVRTVRETG
jgi:signal transduction histidine kinase